MSIFRTAALASCLLLASVAGALPADDVPVASWTAPPFWSASPRAATDGAGPAAKSAARSDREALVLPSRPLPYVAIPPCRQYNSLNSTPLLQATPRTVSLVGAPCGIPATAQAVAVNITIFNITGAGSNGVFKVDVVSPPATAWINYPPTETQRSNAGVVALTDLGEVIVQVNQGAGSVDFVADVAGYYSPVGIVNSLNSLNGDLTLAEGANVTITPSAGTLTIAASGPPGPTGPTGPMGPPGPTGPTGATGTGAVIVMDGNRTVLGTLVGIESFSNNVVTVYNSGYFISLYVSGKFPPSQIYWTGADCGKTLPQTGYLNDGLGDVTDGKFPSIYTKSVVYSTQANSFFLPASPAANISPGSFENISPTPLDGTSDCSSPYPSPSSGFVLTPFDPAATLGWTIQAATCDGLPCKSVPGPLQFP